MQEFKINDYITLKLDWDKTLIFVSNEKFIQCKCLLLNYTEKEISSLSSIASIDEASEALDPLLEDRHQDEIYIDPETEFWGHCSNLQAWAEHDYDTRILKRNLAFPLLKKLTEIGDPIAKRVFKEEIAKRIEMGDEKTILYLLIEDYLKYIENELKSGYFNGAALLSLKNLLIRILDDELTPRETDLKAFKYLQYIIKKEEIKLVEWDGEPFFLKHKVYCSNSKKESLISITKLKDLNSIKQIKGLSKLDNLESLRLHHNNISRIEGLETLKNLKKLDLSGNKIQKIEGLERLKALEVLNLSDNEITRISGLEELVNLREINLSGNPIKTIEGLDSLRQLESLNLDFTEIDDVKGIDTLENLRFLYLNSLPDVLLEKFGGNKYNYWGTSIVGPLVNISKVFEYCKYKKEAS